MPAGSYEGKPLVELLEDGRRVRLSAPFAYIDPATTRWEVPKDAIVDGASIPRALWTLIGGPFEGRYRNASIIHDWYCDLRSRPWKKVHRMFFDAMITSSVPASKARLLYAGVYLGGPRWSKTVVENTGLATGRGTFLTSTPLGIRGGGSATRAPGLGSLRGPSRTVRRKKTVTVVHKYSMSANDLKWLNGTIQGSSSLDSIDKLVDQRLSSRSSRKRTL